jgi:c-di-GMP-related signal transduction protein
MHEKFIARQAIFDDKLRVFAYELLFRAGSENIFRPRKEAANSVIVDSMMLFDLASLTGHAKAFINLDESALRGGSARLLPRDRVVIEILETIAPTPEIVALCKDLHDAGYSLALDDFVGHAKWEPLIPLVKFIKVDFRGADTGTRCAIVQRYRHRGVRFLAEKVETQAELREARSLGYSLFQGFFFCKPSMVSTRDIPGNKLNCLRLLEAVAPQDFSHVAVENLLKNDPSLVYKLLRYLNSPILALRGEVHGVRDAIALLGETEFRRWVSIVAVVVMSHDKPSELIRTALTRGFFCEEIAAPLGMSAHSADLFLMGLLSVTDALLDQPMQHVLSTLPVSPEVRAALSGQPLTGKASPANSKTIAMEALPSATKASVAEIAPATCKSVAIAETMSTTHETVDSIATRFRLVYDTLLAYERADWPALTSAATQLGSIEPCIPNCYHSAASRASTLA